MSLVTSRLWGIVTVDTLGTVIFRGLATMAIIVGLCMMMGPSQIAKASPFDGIVIITIGTIAGVAILDYRMDLLMALTVIVLLGLLRFIVHWVTLRYHMVLHKANTGPVILVKDGKISKANLRKVRVTVETLLQMLREKDIFDITQVEVAVLEHQGNLSVLKKAEFLPLHAKQIQLTTVLPNRILVPVIIEGNLQEQVLKKIGFSPQQIQEFRQQHQAEIHNVFVAFMDKDHKLHIIHDDDPQENGVFWH
jgi:uncharacterized membrane protein YcaP (DUF421 family)